MNNGLKWTPPVVFRKRELFYKYQILFIVWWKLKGHHKTSELNLVLKSGLFLRMYKIFPVWILTSMSGILASQYMPTHDTWCHKDWHFTTRY